MELPGANSLRSKQEATEKAPEKRVEKPAISGSAKTQKKSELKKFAGSIFANDVQSLGKYAIDDVLIPNIKKMISEVVRNGIDLLLYGEVGVSKKKGSGAKISYQGFYDQREERRDYTNRARSALDYDDIIFETRSDAENVLMRMEECIDKYGFVSVGDLYDLADVSSNNYALHKYGWTNLHNAQTVRGRDGFMLKLPRAMALN